MTRPVSWLWVVRRPEAVSGQKAGAAPSVLSGRQGLGGPGRLPGQGLCVLSVGETEGPP